MTKQSGKGRTALPLNKDKCFCTIVNKDYVIENPNCPIHGNKNTDS